jgi:hypothetical protein
VFFRIAPADRPLGRPFDFRTPGTVFAMICNLFGHDGALLLGGTLA